MLELFTWTDPKGGVGFPLEPDEGLMFVFYTANEYGAWLTDKYDWSRPLGGADPMQYEVTFS